MSGLGVHSEVGKLRQVIVHRPDLSLKRLTPGNHDELLFDDVLWVERAQWEHDQFVARMRERDVEVFYVQDLLGEALAASDDAKDAHHRARRERVHGRHRPGRGRARPADGDAAGRACPPPHRRAHPRGVRPRHRCDEGHVADRRGRRRPVDLRPAAVAEHAVHARLVVLDLRRCLDQPDVLARAATRGLSTWPRSTRPTRCSPMAASTSGTRRWAMTTASRPRTSGSRRSRAATWRSSATAPSRSASASGRRRRMIEQIARALFEKGAADRVIAAVMTKDRAHMHLDTVFTMLDRDKATAYPKVVDGHPRDQPAPRVEARDARRARG